MIKRIKEVLRRVLPMEYRFNKIYRTHRFGGKISASGPGADLIQTEAIRQALPVLIKEFKIKIMLDAPCGDYYWMRNVALNVEKYIGADIVSAIVERNQKKYGGKNIEFQQLNIAKNLLPTVDVILCRDCLVHFSYKDIWAVLKNFKRSRSRYLLTTTFTDHAVNEDIVTGEWQPLNLQVSPFNFPEPVQLINERCSEEGGKYEDKCLGLWKLEDIIN